MRGESATSKSERVSLEEILNMPATAIGGKNNDKSRKRRAAKLMIIQDLAAAVQQTPESTMRAVNTVIDFCWNEYASVAVRQAATLREMIALAKKNTGGRSNAFHNIGPVNEPAIKALFDLVQI